MGPLTYVVTAACTGCGGCLLTCPQHAIRPADPVRPADPMRPVRPPEAIRSADPVRPGDPLRPADALRPGEPLRPGSGAPLVVLADLCTGCGECVEVCPADAVVEVAG